MNRKTLLNMRTRSRSTHQRRWFIVTGLSFLHLVCARQDLEYSDEGHADRILPTIEGVAWLRAGGKHIFWIDQDGALGNPRLRSCEKRRCKETRQTIHMNRFTRNCLAVRHDSIFFSDFDSYDTPSVEAFYTFNAALGGTEPLRLRESPSI